MDRTIFLVISGLFLITACSENGGDSINALLAGQYDASLKGPDGDTALVGESIGLILETPESGISQISWQQTSGPSVTFTGANRKVIGFDVPATGTYGFNVNFKDSSGGARSVNYSFTTMNDSPVYLNARLDHEANSEAKITLYAYDNFPGILTNVNWTQITGPAATIPDNNKKVIHFIAPFVTEDTLLQFRVEASDDQGNSANDIVNILLEPEPVNPDSFFESGRFANISLADTYPYNADSVYADNLQECIYSNTTTTYCNLEKLPFIGTQNATPSVNDIMDRLLVSHDWMGARFKYFIEQIDINNDIKNLFGATRSIVISYDIKPSFFWAGTGAIYIDAKYFWVTPQERDTLNAAPDFRQDFSTELKFRDPLRMIKDNNYAYTMPSLASRATRTVQESRFYTLRVLYHELAHANDFFPPRAWDSATPSNFSWSYSVLNQPDSKKLAAAYTLNPEEMHRLGGVMFRGNIATQTQKNYTPSLVSDFFFPFSATSSYNYSTIAEDYAMLAEEYLMGYRHDIQYDQGITGLAPDYIISTAERGRIGHDRIKPRAEFVVSRILPSIDVQAASATLATPISLDSGVSWWDSLVPSSQKKLGVANKVNRSEHPILFGKDFHPAGELEIKKIP
ncbi:MAG: hypothetical protein L3J98_17565 [Gammaproteobacteria bacterium]|nr:hypothetical protein [Gammaproteobacteria bacterium]MCF6261933.1 hypothetical protein [Gammaproteobacteria bacterium]